MGYHDLTKAARLSPPVDTSVAYDLSSLNDKTILITGGSLGLGAAFARHWASHGAHLVIGDLDDQAGEQLVAELRSTGPSSSHHFVHCDVTNWDDQVALFKAAARASPRGRIDVVVVNAGVNDPAANAAFEAPQPAGSGADADAPRKPDMKIIDVNVTAAMYTAHLAMFWLPRDEQGGELTASSRRIRSGQPGPDTDGKDTGDSCLVLVGSIAGLTHYCGQAQYTASKHAVTGLFRALRGTAWARGVRVNMVCPYFVGGSRMLPPIAEALFLGGGAGAAEHADVVGAATRLVADRSIVGRALAVGPKVGVDGWVVEDEGGEEGAAEREERHAKGTNKESNERAVWDCYAEDYRDGDIFVARWVQGLNAIEKARGWAGFWWDFFAILFRRRGDVFGARARRG